MTEKIVEIPAGLPKPGEVLTPAGVDLLMKFVTDPALDYEVVAILCDMHKRGTGIFRVTGAPPDAMGEILDVVRQTYAETDRQGYVYSAAFQYGALKILSCDLLVGE